MKKNLSSQGFSLIEMLIVISIVGIMAAMALPGISGANNRRDLELAAQNLVSDIRLTQQLNMNSDGYNNYTLYFFMPKNSPNYYLIRGAAGQIKRVYLPGTITFNRQPNPISFSVSGVPVGLTNSAQTITLKNSNGRLFFVSLAPVTGRVRSFTTN